jgi:MFS family permease
MLVSIWAIPPPAMATPMMALAIAISAMPPAMALRSPTRAATALALRWPVPSSLLWGIAAGVGAATVLSFAMLAEHFPKEIAGQANAALNLLHVDGAFLLQSGIGLVIGQWTAADGHYPSAAYQTSFGIIIALQIVALLWFVRPDAQARRPTSELIYATTEFIRPIAKRPTLDGYKLVPLHSDYDSFVWGLRRMTGSG